MKRNGHYAHGRQRLLCRACQRSFHWGIQSGRHGREAVWFKKWVIEGYSVRQLVQQSGHSRDKLYRIINYWLACSPSPDRSSLRGCKHVIFDGTFLHRPTSIVAIMDAATNGVISGKYGVSENSERQLTTFFNPLKDRGLSPVSCTTDGNPQALRVLKSLWPGITIQRCLVHIQRQGLMWCRRFPKRTYARKLREIFRQVTYIRTKEERDRFIACLVDWEEEYGRFVATEPERGRVFSDIKRARSMLLKALPDMFIT